MTQGHAPSPPPERMDLFGATLERPAWMRDATWYEFKFAAGPVESVAFEVQDAPPEALEGVLHLRRERMLSMPHTAPSETRSYPAQFPCRGFFVNTGEPGREVGLVGLGTPNRVTTVLSNGEVGHEAVLMDWIGRATPGPTPCKVKEGERDYGVAGLNVPLPVTAIPPRHFVLRGEEASLIIDWVEPGSASPELDVRKAFSLYPEVPVNVAPAQHRHVDQGQVTMDELTLEASAVIEGAPVQYFLGRAYFASERTALSLFAKGEGAGASQMKQAFYAIVASIKLGN